MTICKICGAEKNKRYVCLGCNADKRRANYPNFVQKLYEILKRRGWPTGYPTLCYNCNNAKEKGCPHEAPR